RGKATAGVLAKSSKRHRLSQRLPTNRGARARKSESPSAHDGADPSANDDMDSTARASRGRIPSARGALEHTSESQLWER
ncbi:hypothetical protein B0H10DRAFT_2127538, partial [Mycena sp. CBHHK59/15]